MNSVADLVDEEALKQFTTPSILRDGQEIVDTAGVTFTEFSPLRVAAHVSGPSTQPRNTILESTPSGLHWQCSCSSNKAKFCKHVAATALETWHKSPSRH